jgi:hypothetical protein
MEAFETSGYTLKEESISALSTDIIKGSFVLEINQPFPGYYGLIMKEANVPRSVFFITSEKYSWENILRATDQINKKKGSSINGAAAEITVGRRTYFGIRVKGISAYGDVRKFQEAYQALGFTMQRSRRINEKKPALIKVKKFFHIHEIADGVFTDDRTADMSYILADSHWDWEDFRKATNYIKNNMEDHNYDIVCGVFYMNGGVRDMVRILKPEISRDMLLEIQSKYSNEHRKYL